MNLSSKDRENLERIYESIISEDMTSGGVFGGVGYEMGNENQDNYAPDVTYNPYSLGMTTRKGRIQHKPKNKSNSTKKRRKVAKKEPKM
jgi:hypothetical protein